MSNLSHQLFCTMTKLSNSVMNDKGLQCHSYVDSRTLGRYFIFLLSIVLTQGNPKKGNKTFSGKYIVLRI